MKLQPFYRYAFATILVVFVCLAKKFIPVLTDGTPFLVGFTPICIVAWYYGRACGLYTTILFIGLVNILFMNTMNGENEISMVASDLIKCLIYMIESVILVVLIDHCRRSIKSRDAAADFLNDQLKSYISISETIPHMIWWAKHDHQIMSIPYLNSQWEVYTGIETPSLIDRGWLELGVIHPDDVKVLVPRWNEWVALGLPYTYECRLRDAHGNYRTHLARVKPLRNPSGNIAMWVGTMTDIHEEKLAVDRIAQADKRKDEFLAMLAHELRNPLAPIRNCVSLLQKLARSNPELNSILVMMERQLRQLTRLIEDLMDVSRINQDKIALQVELLDLTTVLSQSVDAAKAIIDDKRQRLKFDLPPCPIWIDGDRTRLAQVFSNLLTNASKYTEEEGNIAITLDRRGDSVVVKIVDDGTGIDPKIQPFIFDLFVQVQENLARSQGGLGIGLTLVRRLVAMHKGEVSVKSDGVGKGSTFTVTLPLSANVVAIDPNNKSGPKMALGCEPLTILIADDNRDSADSIRLYLEHEGHTVHVAHDGEDALRQIASVRPDVAVLDIGMPAVNGYDVAQTVRGGSLYAGSEDMLLIAATGYGQPNDKQMAAMCGFDHHLTKPVDLSKLLSILATDQINKKMGSKPVRQATRRPLNVSQSNDPA